MSRLLTITDIAPPLSLPLEKSVCPLFYDNITIFVWLQTTANIPTTTLPCPVCQRKKKCPLTPLLEDAVCQLNNDYAINPIGARIVSLKCLWNHILFNFLEFLCTKIALCIIHLKQYKICFLRNKIIQLNTITV